MCICIDLQISLEYAFITLKLAGRFDKINGQCIRLYGGLCEYFLYGKTISTYIQFRHFRRDK